jgi:superfamily II DNA or RNA helicase
MGAFGDLLGRLDPDPRRRGTQFEHICKWFLTNEPLYKTRLRHVWLWKEWPDRWSDSEAGIDLVAEDYDGQLWAVQAKAYAEHRDIPKRELDKFLSESNQAKFSQRLLIATTDRLHHIAQRTISAQEKNVSVVGLSDLREADEYLEWPDSPDDLRPSPPLKPSKPHDYQREAINDVIKGFKNANRGQLIMACGTGKTLTSLFIKERLAAQRTLVLVPSLSLLKQTMRVWSAHTTDEFTPLPVCSDPTVTRDDDAAVMHTSDLGVPVTTDATAIAVFLRKHGPRVVFSTYQSSPQIAEAFKLGRVPAFDLVIADEAHRCAGPVSSDFATILDPAKIKTQRRLFMTATPRYFTGRVIREAKEADFAYASMDDEEKFGMVFHRLGFSDAIKRRLLTDYQVAVIGVDDAMYRAWAEKSTLVSLDGKTPTSARTLAGQIGLAKAMRKYHLRRTISFHSRVSSAKQFAASMHGVLDWMPSRQRPNGRLWAEHASGEMSAGFRSRLIQRLSALAEGERGLLTNARCLAEGVNVPTLDGVAFIDPRRSEVDIVQAVGRAIRKTDDKSVGTIIIPVFIDTDEAPEIALDSSAFKPVWDVVKALRAHDEELGRQLDELRRDMGKLGGVPQLPNKIQFDVPTTVTAAFVDAFDVKLVEETTARWEFWLGLLEQYIQENGDALVPAKGLYHGRKLGAWVNEQRTLYYDGSLSPLRVERLSGLDSWVWDARAAAWEDAAEHLERYADENGDALVPTNCIVDGFRLGQWVGIQRMRYTKGTLSTQRKDRLSAVKGWVWDLSEAKWEQGFRHLLRYFETYGTTDVPQKYEAADGYRLGSWVNTQRQAYKQKKAKPDHVKRLLEAFPDWNWNPGVGRWEEGLRHLLRFIETENHANVPQRYDLNGYPLGSWASTQRAHRAQGVLRADREERLAQIPEWRWQAREDQWEQTYLKLLDYVKENNTSRVPQGHRVDGFNLGGWVQQQRSRFARQTITQDQKNRLGKLPGWQWSRGPVPTKSARLTAEQKAELRRRAASGEPVGELAAAFGIGRATAYRHLAND